MLPQQIRQHLSTNYKTYPAGLKVFVQITVAKLDSSVFDSFHIVASTIYLYNEPRLGSPDPY